MLKDINICQILTQPSHVPEMRSGSFVSLCELVSEAQRNRLPMLSLRITAKNF